MPSQKQEQPRNSQRNIICEIEDGNINTATDSVAPLRSFMRLDVHVHPVLVKELTDSRPSLLQDARQLFDLRTAPQPLSTLLDEMDVCEIDRAVLLALDCPKLNGSKMPSNDEVASLVKQNSPRFIGFASVDPDSKQNAVAELKRAKDQMGLRGLKLNPALQELDPASDAAVEVYKEA
jgi:uncharacterized protein